MEKAWVFAEAGATAEVEIIINPAGLTFSPDGYYEVTDRMSNNLSLFVGSLRVYEQVDGEWEPRPLTQVSSLSNEHWSFTITSDNEFSLIFPDSVPIRLTYRVLVRGAIGDTVEISNQVEVAGKIYDAVRDFFNIVEYDGGAFGDQILVTLYKHSEDNAESLAGARFALYMGANIAGHQPEGLPADIPLTKDIDGTTFFLIDAGITNELGIIVFDDPWLATFRLPRPYAIVEISPPPGYILPEDPITLFSFRDLAHWSESLGGREIHQIADNIIITNEGYWTPIGDMPLTGGTVGAIFFTAGGALLLGAAGLLFWKLQKKQKKS